MSELFPDILRSVVTNLCFLLLLFSLAQPKYNKRITVLFMVGIVLLDVVFNVVFYRTGNYTAVVYASIFISIPVLFLTKPLFKESIMQWCFNVVTATNIFAVVVFVTFHLSRHLPHPEYSNTLLRLLVYLVVIWLFYHVLRPLHAGVLEHWQSYFFAAISILICFFYTMISGGDVKQALSQQTGILTMLCIMTVCVYGSIFWSLKVISHEYALREENLHMKEGEDLLRASANALEQRLAVMDEAEKKAQVLRHDQRHFDAEILELLYAGKVKDAAELLERQTALKSAPHKNYCRNTTVNAIVSYYIAMAENNAIHCEVSMDVPKEISVDSLELSMALSNLLENAIHACQTVPEKKRLIRCNAAFAGQLLVGVENSCSPDVKLDEDGLPVSNREGHGVGTKSVLAFVKRCHGEVIYHVSDGVFQVRLML